LEARHNVEGAGITRRVRFFEGNAVTTVIGLTGGIASGKSVVSRMLAERGALVIDADKVGHEAYAPGSDCYRLVIDAFGADIVASDGQIDRKALGAKVFGDPEQRKRLEGIVWPWMRATMDGRLQRLREEGVPVVVLEAAVLIEADWIPIVDQVWLVTVPPEIAKERIMSRNALSAEQAEQRIAAQLTNEERARHAQVIIDNSGTLQDLEQRVGAEWDRLAAAAGRNA
jgi:dephospho-CoA kinase